MQLTRHLVVLTLMALIGLGPLAAAETYGVDPNHSQVGFAVRHFGVSTVRGQFTDYAAELSIDEDDLANSSVKLTIQSASVDTHHEDRDGHLRSGDFFDTEGHPTIVFESSAIRADGAGFVATGELTIKGITQEVSFPVTVGGPIKDPYGNMRVGIEGELTIDRQEFGVSWNKAMEAGGWVVSDDVDISFELEATRKPSE